MKIKKIILVGLMGAALSLLCSGYISDSTAAGIRLGWSTEQQNRWTQMYNENHPLWQRLKALADDPNRYEDQGIQDGMVYLITGNTAYAQSAFNHVDWWCGKNYKPSGCAEPTRNDTRHHFLNLAILYDWVSPALSSSDRDRFRDILEHWVDLVFDPNHGTRTWDSDEMTGHYFGVTAYAVALLDEDPARSNEIFNMTGTSFIKPHGGLDATGQNTATWRNTISRYATNLAVGGEWMESSRYNLNTVQYLLSGAAAINTYYGEDKFPEITALYDDFAKAFVQALAPTYYDSFQWGDEQLPRNMFYWARVPLMSTVSGLSKDPNALYVFDKLYQQNGSAGMQASWTIYADPYSPREAPSGVTHHNAYGRGLAYYHSGWNANDSFFASGMFTHTYVDHERESLTNFNLFRNGGWAVTNPKGYYGTTIEAPWMNGLLVNGGLAGTKEAFGQTAYEAGDNYLYHAGATAGQIMPAKYDDPPKEFLHEWNRSYLYIHHTDDSDSVVIFDRLNSSDPQDTNTMSNWKFNRIPRVTRDRIVAANSKHQWVMHIPDSNPQINGNTISWVAENGETVTLKTFMQNYTTQLYDESSHYNSGAPLYLQGYMYDSELKYQLRLIPEQKTGFQTFANVVHVGSQATISKFTAHANENAQGILIQTGTQNVLAIFNGTENMPPPPSSINGPPNGWSSVHDPLRLEKTKALRLFKTGYDMNVTVDGLTEVFLTDLDPAKSWTIAVNGVSDTLNVSSEGIARHSFIGSGSNQIHVSASDVDMPVAAIQVASVNDLTVQFKGDQSYVPDNSYAYSWDFGDGLTSVLMNPSHTFPSGGDYTVTLTVSNGTLSDSDTTTVSVGQQQASNTAPVIDSVSGNNTIEVGSTVTVTVSASDADQDSLTLTAQMSHNGVTDAVSSFGAQFTDNGNGTGIFSWTPQSDQTGDYTLSFTVSDGTDTGFQSFSLTVTQPPSGKTEYHWLEAEYYSTITAPMVSASDNNASLNQYIHAPDGSGNNLNDNSTMATYTVTITEPGDYVLWGRVIAPATDADSFFVQIDDGTVNLWDVQNTSSWQWDLVNNRGTAAVGQGATVVATLSSGQHTIKIKLREDGTKIDKLLLTNDTAYTPSATGQTAENIPSSDICGDGQVSGSEVCDGGTRSCSTAEGYNGTQSCDAQCAGYTTCTATEYCGDGTINGNEQCDDGNTASGDGCSASCQTETSGGQNVTLGIIESLTNSTVTFRWTKNPNASKYWLSVGTSLSAIKNDPWGDIYSKDVGASLSKTVSGIPINGANIYVRLWALVNGSWLTDDYVYPTGSGNPVCGDGIINGNEVCDGGTRSCTVNGYAGTQSCNSTCDGYVSCTATQSCGDGTVNGNEVCDGNTQSCTVNGYAGSQDCNSTCDGYNSCSTIQSCGDGTVNGNEQCDDGNTTSGDGCDASCQTENQVGQTVTLGTSAVITSSMVTFTWVFDASAENYWLSVGTSYGSLRHAPWGDIYSQALGITTSQVVSEVPVDGSTVYVRLWKLKKGTWVSEDYTYLTSAGNATCGDGVVSGGELCDGGTQSCTTADGYSGTQACNAQCSAYNTCVTTEFCGDGTVNGTEQCDDGNAVNGDGCSASCQIESQGGSQTITLGTTSGPINSSDITLTWAPKASAQKYWLSVGTSFSSVKNAPWGDIYSADVGSSTSVDVSGVPVNGRKIYIRLWWLVSGQWLIEDYTFTTTSN